MKLRSFLNSRAEKSPYWNPYAETLPREQLEDLHLRKLRALMEYAHHASPFYRRKFQQAQVRPEDIKTLEDFKKRVPLTDKSEFISLQQENPPYGETGALPLEYVAFHSETSGTTGVPLGVPFTSYDMERYGESWIYGYWALGIRPQDTFYFAFNWGLFGGFWSAYWGARRLGVRVVSGGGQNSEGHLRLIQRLKPTVLLATPTYALRLAETARGLGIDPGTLGIRYTYHAGEPGPCSIETMRKQLENSWKAVAGELYGIQEIDAMAPGCPTGTGVHMNELNTFSWSCHPETGQEVAEGEIGENIVTSYVNSAQPLLNYRTHDLVQRHLHCECGRTWHFLKGVVLGRSDFMVAIRGVNVYQTAVENVLGKIAGLSSHYELVITRDRGLDEMTVRAEPVRDVVVSDYGKLASGVEQSIREALGVRLGVELVAPGSLPRYELKTKRIIDKRPKEVRRILDRG
ncbi:MAG: hypothetical protein HY652_02720 [Acidobacteria bacterium]|nr:hypothetical protein [Acidobacteriota bacterium]